MRLVQARAAVLLITTVQASNFLNSGKAVLNRAAFFYLEEIDNRHKNACEGEG